MGEVAAAVLSHRCQLVGALLEEQEGRRQACSGAAGMVLALLFGNQLIPLPAFVIVLVWSATAWPASVILLVPMEGLPVPQLPCHIGGVPAMGALASIPLHLLWVILLLAPGVLAFQVVVSAPVLV